MSEQDKSKPIFESNHLKIKQCRYGIMAFMPHDTYVGRSLDLYGEYCFPETRIISSVVMSGFTAIDAGANIGAHTVLMSKLVGSTGKVFSFEPQKAIFNILCTNITLNRCINVEAVNLGLGASSKETRIKCINYSHENNFGSVSLGDHEDGEQIRITTIDGLNLKNCHFLKADIEGMETELLEGAQRTIQMFRPILYLEDNGGSDGARMFYKVKSMGYRCYWHNCVYFHENNYYGNKLNVFPSRAAINMICIPQEAEISVDVVEITDPAEHPFNV